MAYRDFTLEKALDAFALTVETAHLNAEAAPFEPSEHLAFALGENLELASAISTEKARSELLIAPVLLEIRRHNGYRVNFFSGSEFNVDAAAGLTGFCDYLLSLGANSYRVGVPVVAVVEAKNENLKGGLGQCIAEMVAARRFNERDGRRIPIGGAVTTGTLWQFLRLTDETVTIDPTEYVTRTEAPQILGILQSFVGDSGAIGAAA